jgi:hypothetical protein
MPPLRRTIRHRGAGIVVRAAADGDALAATEQENGEGCVRRRLHRPCGGDPDRVCDRGRLGEGEECDQRSVPGRPFRDRRDEPLRNADANRPRSGRRRAGKVLRVCGARRQTQRVIRRSRSTDPPGEDPRCGGRTSRVHRGQDALGEREAAAEGAAKARGAAQKRQRPIGANRERRRIATFVAHNGA